MMEHMAGVWTPVRGVTIRSELCQRRFLFQFFHHLDLQKVLKGGPWFFNKHMLILGAVEEGEGPEQMPLNTTILGAGPTNYQQAIYRRRWEKTSETMSASRWNMTRRIALVFGGNTCVYIDQHKFGIGMCIRNDRGSFQKAKTMWFNGVPPPQ
jgi:hypothetical protein